MQIREAHAAIFKARQAHLRNDTEKTKGPIKKLLSMAAWN